MVAHGYGWKPSLPDIRNYKLSFRGAEIASEVDLRTTGFLPEIWDQGQLGSCTAFGTAAAYSFDLEKQIAADNFRPSQLYIYYNTRILENTVNEDSGATITNAIKSLNKYGAPPNEDWQYDINEFTTKPPQKAYDDGALREAVKYAQVSQSVSEMQACLTSGTPIVIGFTVYDSFESDAVANNGVVPMPASNEKVLGGHCVVVVGYLKGSTIIAALQADGLSASGIDSNAYYWVCRNSWGEGWGHHGYFYFPQAYLTNGNLANDFWTVQSVSSPDPAPAPPQPEPQPVPTEDTDLKLFDATRAWSLARHCCSNKQAALAVQAWASAKGFS